MTPRERILATLDGRQPDRLPLDFAGTDCSSIHIAAYHRLRQTLRIEPRPVRLGCLSQQIAAADLEVLEAMGSDVQILLFGPRQWRSWQSGFGFDVDVPALWRPRIAPDGSAEICTADGKVSARRPSGGLYFDSVGFPLRGVSRPEDLAAHKALFDRWDWPAVFDESIEEYAARARALYEKTDRAVVADWRMHYLQAGQLMRGYEEFMVDLLADESLARAILDELHEAYMRRARAFLDAMGRWMDIVFFTDDLGTQQGPLLGPPTYRRLVKPYWQELIALVKSYGKKVIMHSCGAVSEFIPDFIEMGVDALNPVQITATGMSPERLKREFGRDITFWGGGVSTQGVLDAAGPAEVREQVKRNIEVFAAGGRYVFTQVHNIQADVPPDNVLAAYETARQMA